MRLLRSRTKLFGVLVVAAVAAVPTRAQMPGGPTAGAMNAALTKLFGDTKAFTAKAEVRVLDAEQKELVNMPLEFALLDQGVRVAVDMAQMKNREMPPGAADQLKKMGMAQVTSIIRPDKKIVYVIYPDAKVLMTMPMSQADADSARSDAKLKKTELGKETIDGHPCVKNKVVLTQENGRTVEATTWNATDLKDFPLQILTQEQGTTSVIHYTQIQFAKPDAKLFEPPAGFTEYKDQQELMQGVLKKMAESGASR